MRAISEHLAAPQMLADHFPTLPHNHSKDFSPIVPAVFSQKTPDEAESSRNSLSWTILRVTPLF
jgi:hypothetical protein